MCIQNYMCQTPKIGSNANLVKLYQGVPLGAMALKGPILVH